MTVDIAYAKRLAAYLRGDIPYVVRNPLCDIGYPKCRCQTCQGKFKGANSRKRKKEKQ